MEIDDIVSLADRLELAAFLAKYPGMSIAPSRDRPVNLIGMFKFSAQIPNGICISDSYYLRISIPEQFPRDIPKAEELNQVIPRDGNHHVNPDGTLCLGSHLRLLTEVSLYPTLLGFAERCLVPYLYAISHKIKYGGEFIFGELSHGSQGLIDDYRILFGLDIRERVKDVLFLLTTKKRLANKLICPCGCGLRLGKCKLHYRINEFRKLASRSWFRANVYETI